MGIVKLTAIVATRDDVRKQPLLKQQNTIMLHKSTRVVAVVIIIQHVELYSEITIAKEPRSKQYQLDRL